MQAGTTRNLYYVELGVCTFAEMHYNTEGWLRKKFLMQFMQAYEFGVVLCLAPIQRLHGLKRKATGICVLIKQMMKILYCKIKAKAPR